MDISSVGHRTNKSNVLLDNIAAAFRNKLGREATINVDYENMFVEINSAQGISESEWDSIEFVDSANLGILNTRNLILAYENEDGFISNLSYGNYACNSLLNYKFKKQRNLNAKQSVQNNTKNYYTRLIPLGAFDSITLLFGVNTQFKRKFVRKIKFYIPYLA